MRWRHSRTSEETSNLNTTDRVHANAKRELKKYIHRLYQIIHPDRLHRFPKQRQVNESSFQVLQSELDKHLKTHSKKIFTSKSSGVRQLTFFACLEDLSHSNNKEVIIDNGIASIGLYKAVVSFHETQLATALRDLFIALGLDEPPANALAIIGRPKILRTRLLDLVERARHMRAKATIETYESNSTFLEQAIYRAYGVRVEVKDSSENGEEVLRRIAKALVDCGANLRPVVFTIDNSKTVTVEAEGDVGEWMPRVRLGMHASLSSWYTVLRSPLLVSLCNAARIRASHLCRYEAAAARALGVRLVLCEVAASSVRDSSDNALLNAYAELVSGIARGHDYCITKDSSCEHPDSHLLSVMVTRGSSNTSDTDTGVLRVGIEGGASAVTNAVRGANSMASAYRQLYEMRVADKKLCADVRRSIHASHIRRAPGLIDIHWRSTLRRLLAKAHVLRNITKGTSLVVGTQTRLLDSGEIEIAHNFDFNDIL